MNALDRRWSRKSHISRTDSPALLLHVTGDRIGDALLKLPAIVGLRRALPDHRIIWMAGRRASAFNGPFAPLVKGVLDEVHDESGLGTRWRELIYPRVHGHFDIVVATEPKLRDALILKSIPHRCFISPAWRFLLSDRRLSPGVPYPDTAFDRMCCLMSLAAGRPITVERRIAVPEDCVTAAAEYLPAGPCYVGIAPGSGGASKRWPLSRFIEVAAEQSRRGRVPVFFLGPQERAWRGELQEAVPGALFPEYDARGAPRAGALLTIALARQLAVGLANDSGGGHLLAAGGQPMVSLYGHTDERKFAPPYGPRTAIRAKDHGGAEMKRIPVQSVLDAIDEQLVQPGS